MNLSDAKKLIEFCEAKRIHRVKLGDMEVEFFKKDDSMPLDPASLAKTLTSAMPPDSAMLFASVDGEIPEIEKQNPQTRESVDMT